VKSLNLKMCLLVIAAMLAFGQTARAAGTPSYDWTGWYIGAHLGYGWGNADTGIAPFLNGQPWQGTLSPSKLQPDPGGITAGGQFGYNLQMGSFVLGIETDFSPSAISGTSTVAPVIQDGIPAPGSSAVSHEDMSWYGTLRPRVGYTVTPPLLLYGTGGLAYGHVNYSANVSSPFVQYAASTSATSVGWAAGGGLEYAIGKRWSVKLEYLYMNLGSQSMTANESFFMAPAPGVSRVGNPDPIAPSTFQMRYNWDTAFQVFNVGLNFKF
jgi:outer membrane immunogenic protein